MQLSMQVILVIDKMEFLAFLNILLFSGGFIIPCECSEKFPNSVQIARLQISRFDKKGIASRYYSYMIYRNNFIFTNFAFIKLLQFLSLVIYTSQLPQIFFSEVSSDDFTVIDNYTDKITENCLQQCCIRCLPTTGKPFRT